MAKQAIIRVSNSFTSTETQILKDIIDMATTQEFRGRSQLLKIIDNPCFGQLYRKLAAMQDKADQLHVSARTGQAPPSEKPADTK